MTSTCMLSRSEGKSSAVASAGVPTETSPWPSSAATIASSSLMRRSYLARSRSRASSTLRKRRSPAARSAARVASSPAPAGAPYRAVDAAEAGAEAGAVPSVAASEVASFGEELGEERFMSTTSET